MIAITVDRGPERTCLGCRKRDGQGALVRLAADGDRVVVDLNHRCPGRGAWVHLDRACAARLTVGAVERGLRRKLGPHAIAGVADTVADYASAGRGARHPDLERVELTSSGAK